MMKKIIRGMGILALCLMTAVLPVRAADDPVSLIKNGSGVKVILSKEAIDDEVHSLHLSLEVDVTKGKLTQDEVSFDWAISDDAYKTQFCEKKDGGFIVDIYTSAKENIFSAGDDGLTLGVVKLSPAKGKVTAKVTVAGSLETVNGVQELNQTQGNKDVSVEVTAGKSSGSSHSSSSGGGSSSGGSSSGGSSSGGNTNNNPAANRNNTVLNNPAANLGINNNNSIVQAVPDNSTVQNPVTNQNKNGQGSGNSPVQKEDSADSQSVAQTEVTGTEMVEPEETKTEQEMLSESEKVLVADADNGNESEQRFYPEGGCVTETSGMATSTMVLLGIIIAAVVGVGAFFVIKNKP